MQKYFTCEKLTLSFRWLGIRDFLSMLLVQNQIKKFAPACRSGLVTKAGDSQAGGLKKRRAQDFESAF